jgi:hypothetical protein
LHLLADGFCGYRVSRMVRTASELAKELNVARASGTVELAGTVDAVWPILTDFQRYPEWLAFHKQWLEEPPARAEVGAALKQSVVILGPPAVVDWSITAVDDGELLELTGKAAAGLDARLAFRVAGAGDGATLTIEIEVTGGSVFGPIGDLVQQAAQGLVDTSLQKFAATV